MFLQQPQCHPSRNVSKPSCNSFLPPTAPHHTFFVPNCKPQAPSRYLKPLARSSDLAPTMLADFPSLLKTASTAAQTTPLNSPATSSRVRVSSRASIGSLVMTRGRAKGRGRPSSVSPALARTRAFLDGLEGALISCNGRGIPKRVGLGLGHPLPGGAGSSL